MEGIIQLATITTLATRSNSTAEKAIILLDLNGQSASLNTEIHTGNMMFPCANVSMHCTLHFCSIDFVIWLSNHSIIFLAGIITCPELRDPDNGDVNFNSVKPGSVAKYKCNRGFQLVGSPSRKCQDNGEWTGKDPVCKRTQ